MKARAVGATVVDLNGELYVNITLKLPGQSLTKLAGLVDEAARKRKQKEIVKLIEAMEFPND